MLITNRNYSKYSRNLSPKKIFLFVEGKKREVDYFKMFESNSKIEVLIYKLEDGDDNTAIGLYKIAKRVLKSSKSDKNYRNEDDFEEYDYDGTIDELWIIVDADINRDKIFEAEKKCCNENNWNLALSNPCFEVWLYYHFSGIKLTPEMLRKEKITSPIDKCKAWKQFVNNMKSGGFDSKNDVKLIGDAIINAEKNYSESNQIPDVASTQVFRLAKDIQKLNYKKS
ncbi:RloB domain-containing protein [bacterium]|nr:RloB domain-containing protein [bacterium]